MESKDSRHRALTVDDLAKVFDVPPWLVDGARQRPRFARVRWALRRVWPLRPPRTG